jgi:hypothetical protein
VASSVAGKLGSRDGKNKHFGRVDLDPDFLLNSGNRFSNAALQRPIKSFHRKIDKIDDAEELPMLDARRYANARRPHTDALRSDRDNRLRAFRQTRCVELSKQSPHLAGAHGAADLVELV